MKLCFWDLNPSRNVYRNEVYYRATAMLAWLYLEHQSNPTKALSAVEYATRYREADPHLLDTLGWVHSRAGKYTEAQSVLEPLSRGAGKELAAVHFHLADTYYRLGRHDLARSQLEAALRSPETFAGRAEALTLKRRLMPATQRVR